MIEDYAGTAYAYARVSSARQAERGQSLEDQTQAILAYYAYRKVPFDPAKHLFVDRGLSAFKKDILRREAGGELCRRLRPGDHIAMTKLDRGFRRVVDGCRTVGEWQRRGIGFHLVSGEIIDTTSAAGTAFFQMMLVFAEWNSSNHAERVAWHNRQRKARCMPVNRHPPHGFRWVKRNETMWELVPDFEQREKMAQLLELYEGGMKLERIRQHVAYRLKWQFAKRHPNAKPLVAQWSPLLIFRWIRSEIRLQKKEASDPARVAQLEAVHARLTRNRAPSKPRLGD
jgi:DNA invertase Pin-like site-specific DNA recombinase